MPHGRFTGVDRPMAEAKIQLYTTYTGDMSFGEELENVDTRRTIEDSFQRSLERMVSGRDVKVELSPAGKTVGVTVEFGVKNVTSEDEEEVLSFLDDQMEQRANATRPARGEPDYEWQVR